MTFSEGLSPLGPTAANTTMEPPSWLCKCPQALDVLIHKRRDVEVATLVQHLLRHIRACLMRQKFTRGFWKVTQRASSPLSPLSLCLFLTKHLGKCKQKRWRTAQNTKVESSLNDSVLHMDFSRLAWNAVGLDKLLFWTISSPFSYIQNFPTEIQLWASPASSREKAVCICKTPSFSYCSNSSL